MSGEFWPGDRQCRRLKPLLPNKPRGVCRTEIFQVLRTVGLLKRFRRVATRYDKLATNFLAPASATGCKSGA